MLNIDISPEFWFSFNKDGNPLNGELTEELETALKASQEELVAQVDAFVRAALKKAISDDTIALFVNLNKNIPTLDLNILFLSPNSKKVSVVFRGHELGHATFETHIMKSTEEGNIVLIHKVKDVWL